MSTYLVRYTYGAFKSNDKQLLSINYCTSLNIFKKIYLGMFEIFFEKSAKFYPILAIARVFIHVEIKFTLPHYNYIGWVEVISKYCLNLGLQMSSNEITTFAFK